MMIGMTLYFVAGIVTPLTLALLIAAYAVATGLFLLYDLRHTHTTTWRHIKTFMGLGLVLIGLLMASQTLREGPVQDAFGSWHMPYTQARKQAHERNVLLLIDFLSLYCTLCREVEKNIFSAIVVQEKLEQLVPIVIVDGEPNSQELQTQFGVRGFPTILLVDPTSEKVIARWGGELAHEKPELFAQELSAAS